MSGKVVLRKERKKLHKQWLILMDSKRCSRQAERKLRSIRKNCHKDKNKLVLLSEYIEKLRKQLTRFQNSSDKMKRSFLVDKAIYGQNSQNAKDSEKKCKIHQKLRFECSQHLAESCERRRELEEHLEELQQRVAHAYYVWQPLYCKYKYLKKNFKQKLALQK